MKIIHLDLLLLIEQEQCLNISGICYIKKIKEKKIEIFFFIIMEMPFSDHHFFMYNKKK